MQSSFLRRTLPRTIIALAVMALGVFLSRGGDNANATFTATSNTLVAPLTAGANATITTTLLVPLNDYNFSAVINGTPSAAFVAPGPGCTSVPTCGGVFVPGTHPALGDVIGTLTSSSTLGLTGNPCGSPVTPAFTFLNATTNNAAGNIIDAVPQNMTNTGSGQTLDNMWSDDGASTTGPGAVAPWNLPWGDGAGHGAGSALSAAERINGLPAQVDRYPSYLNIIFDPDFPATPGTNAVQPLARYAGAVNVVGTSVVLDLVVFGPGVLSGAFAAPHPFNATSTIGYTQIAVLNDATTPASHGSISDFCSPLTTVSILNGMAKVNPCKVAPGGAACDTQTEISAPAPGANTFARYANPASGTYSWIAQLQSLRDHDGDDIENGLDTCAQFPEAPAAAYNPRIPAAIGGDPDNDNDGLANICDPYDFDGNFDHDGDGWENSYDNCPLIGNPTQDDSEVNVGTYAATAPGGGPRGDSVGDVCDFNDNLVIGDGYSTILEAGTPLCLNSANDDDKTGAGLVADDALINDGCPAAPGGAGVENCADAVDNDADGYVNDGCAAAGAFSEAFFNIGTNPDVRCGVGNEGTGVSSTAWPSDLYSGGIPVSTDKINVLDLTSFIAPVATRRLDTAPGQALFDKRWDLAPGRGVFNNMINVTDLTSLIAASTAGYPPMLPPNDVTPLTTKAFSGPVCGVGADIVSSTLSDGAFIATTTTNTFTMP